MSNNRQNKLSSTKICSPKVEAGKTVSGNPVERRMDDVATMTRKSKTSGRRWVQILSAILLNILAMGVGASYGILNVCSSKLDPKKCDDTNKINEDQFVFGARGTGECSDGEAITDKSTCMKACLRLNIPLKEILGSYNCFKDGQGNCYQNGQNGDGDSLICKQTATQEGKYEIMTGVFIAKGPAVGTGIRNIGPNECADKCTSTTECKAWTFKETISMCWLKSDITRTGHAVGWVTGIKLSPYQPNLMNFSTLEKQCDFTIDSTEKSSIATFSIIGMYSTILFSVPLVVRFGKRISLMIDCILSFIAFLLMSFAMNVEMLCMSKFLLGYVSVNCRSAIQPFICETSNPAIRGITTSLYVLFYIIGQAFSVLIAKQWFDGWRYVSAAFCGLMIVCFLSLLLWIHETPDWLLEKKHFKKATSALEFYEIDREVLVGDKRKSKTKDGKEKSYNEIVSLYEDESKRFANQNTAKTTNWKNKAKEKISNIVTTFKRPDVYKPFVLLTFMLGLMDLSGFVIMGHYSIKLIEEYGYDDATFVDAYYFTVIVYLSRIPSSILVIGVLQKFKKRHIYLVVSSILFFVISGLVAFTWLVASEIITVEAFQGSIAYQLIPLVLFIMFYAAYSFGYGTIPFSLMGELFPPDASSIGNTFAFILSNVFGMIAVQTALLINDTHGLQYVFVIPAGAVVLSILLAGFFMPETHGLSLDEIRQIYTKQGHEEPVMAEEKDIPYYQSLRGESNMELTRAIKQKNSVYPWPSVGSVLSTVTVNEMNPATKAQVEKKPPGLWDTTIRMLELNKDVT